MAQKYYEYINYKEEQEKEKEKQRAPPRDACNAYIIIFQTVFYSCFHVSPGGVAGMGRGPRQQH